MLQIGKIKTVTDLIVNFRNACCHYSSGRKELELGDSNKTIVFLNWFYGEISVGFGDTSIKSKYHDDAGIVIGPHMLYLKRHIDRVFSELKIILKDIVTEYPDMWNGPLNYKQD